MSHHFKYSFGKPGKPEKFRPVGDTKNRLKVENSLIERYELDERFYAGGLDFRLFSILKVPERHVMPRFDIQGKAKIRRDGTYVQHGPGYRLLGGFFDVGASAAVVYTGIQEIDLEGTDLITFDNILIQQINAVALLEVKDATSAVASVGNYQEIAAKIASAALNKKVSDNTYADLKQEFSATSSGDMHKMNILPDVIDYTYPRRLKEMGINLELYVESFTIPREQADLLAAPLFAEKRAEADIIDAKTKQSVAEVMLETGRLLDRSPQAARLVSMLSQENMAEGDSNTIITGLDGLGPSLATAFEQYSRRPGALDALVPIIDRVMPALEQLVTGQQDRTGVEALTPILERLVEAYRQKPNNLDALAEVLREEIRERYRPDLRGPTGRPVKAEE